MLFSSGVVLHKLDFTVSNINFGLGRHQPRAYWALPRLDLTQVSAQAPYSGNMLKGECHTWTPHRLGQSVSGSCGTGAEIEILSQLDLGVVQTSPSGCVRRVPILSRWYFLWLWCFSFPLSETLKDIKHFSVCPVFLVLAFLSHYVNLLTRDYFSRVSVIQKRSW